MGKRHKLAAFLAGTTIIAAVSGPAVGQEMPGGVTLTFGLTSTLRVNDNLDLDPVSPGSTTLWENRLSFGYLTETQISRFSVDLGATLRAASLPGASTSADIDEPSVALRYTREGANSLFEAAANYAQVDLAFEDPLGNIDDDGLITDSGTRTNMRTSLNFETGLNDPLGFGATLSHNTRGFSGTADPDLYDSETNSVELFTRLQFSPLAEGRLTLSRTEYDAEDVEQTERTTQSAVASVTYDINPITTLQASLGYAEIEETTNLPSMTNVDGLIAALVLTREASNGSASLELESSLDEDGRSDTIRIGRALDLPTGSLSASVGATRTPFADWGLIGSLDYARELPRGMITASLDRSFGGDTRTTRAGLGYTTDINPVSSLAFQLDYAETDDTVIVDTTSLSSFRATYTRELTPDWDLSAGYEYRHRTESGTASRDSNEIFLVLERDFTIRR